MLDVQRVKADSERTIRALGGEVLETLPVIGSDELVLRPGADVAARALVLNLLVQMSFGAPAEVAREWLVSNRLLGAVAPSEAAWFEGKGPVDAATRQRLRWCIEPLWAAAWAGSLVDELGPTQPVPNTLAALLPGLRDMESPKAFLQRFRLRSLEALYPTLDLFYRANWFTRNCGLTGRDPAPFNPGIVQARRELLEWTTHAGVGWDDVEMST